MGEVFDTINAELLSDESDSPIAESIRSLQSTIENLESISLQLDVVVRKSSGKIDGTLTNLQSLTGTFEEKSDKIGSIIDNADDLSNQLADANFEETMTEVNTFISSLRTTLDKADQAVGGLNVVMGRINNGEGTLGKLVYDDELYDDLSGLSSRFDSLAEDIQERPYRYVPFKSRKKVKKFDRKDEAAEN